MLVHELINSNNLVCAALESSLDEMIEKISGGDFKKDDTHECDACRFLDFCL